MAPVTTPEAREERPNHSSMYAELLRAARIRHAGHAPADGRVRDPAVLAAQLARLRTVTGSRARVETAHPVGLAGDIAGQLAYDLVLLDLCELEGLDVDMSGFYQPLHERQRLEAALRKVGVDVGTGPGDGEQSSH
jgi:hypothetical protein